MWKKPELEKTASEGYPHPRNERPSSRQVSLVSSALAVKGELSGEEDLVVDGCVEGLINLIGNTVTVGETGCVVGNIHARVIHLKGRLEGDVFGGEQVVVHSSGNVRGNITAPRVCLEDGAKLKGTIDMDPQGAVEGGSLGTRSLVGAGSTKDLARSAASDEEAFACELDEDDGRSFESGSRGLQ